MIYCENVMDVTPLIFIMRNVQSNPKHFYKSTQLPRYQPQLIGLWIVMYGKSESSEINVSK